MAWSRWAPSARHTKLLAWLLAGGAVTLALAALLGLADPVHLWLPVAGAGVAVAAGLAATRVINLERAKLSSIVNALPIAVAAVAANGEVVRWNAAAARLFGWRADEVLGRPLPFLTGADRDRIAVVHARLLRGEVIHKEEIQRCRRDGAVLNLQLSAVPLYDRSRRIVGIIAIYNDVTEQRRVEQALRASEAGYRRLAESNVIGFARVRLDGTLETANDAMRDILGCTREELATGSIRLRDRTAPESLPVEQAAVERILATGNAPAWEKVYLRPDGTRIPALVGAALYEGPPPALIAVAVDLRELRRTETALRQSEELFRMLSTSAPVCIFRMDVEGRCTYVNPRWEAVTGISMQDALGYGWLEAIHPDHRGMFYEWRATARHGAEWSRDYRILSHGQVRWVHARATALRAPDGTVQSYVGTVEDINERKLLDEERTRLLAEEQRAHAAAEEASRAKDRFLAIVSHELRNPLAALSAGVQLLKQAPPGDERLLRVIEVMDRNVRLQARLVNDLIDISRIVRGLAQLQRAPLALTDVVGSAVQDSAGDAQRADVTLESHIEPCGWALADFDRLHQVVTNLLSNAIKFTPAGGRVSVHARAEKGRASISVADTGIGIEAAEMPHLFELFRQGGVGSPGKRGLGIGLALVRSIVEMHGGTARAESAGPGRGSCFTVELPLIDAPRPSDARIAGTSTGARELKLLLVEDNADTRWMVAESLQSLAYRVDAVGSAEEALERLRAQRPDVIIADIGLPGMDGYELLRRAREIRRLADVPAFAMTGYAQDSDLRRAREAGYSGHFTKPVDIPALDRGIRTWLEGRGMATPGARPEARD